MSLGYVVVQLDVTIVNVAINSIGADFGGSVADLQWIVNAYTITFAAFILTAGALGDRLGAQRVFIAGFAIFILASLACALAPALPVLIVARLCQGIGAAILVPNSLALLNHAYQQERERHWAVGIWAAGASFSLTAGPLVGGLLIALSGWRSRHLADLALCDRDRAPGGAHARHTGPDHGGPGAGIARRGDDRRRRTRLERFVRAHGLCRLRGAGSTLSCHRIQIASPDVAARLVPQARVQRNVPDRSFGQYQLLRPDLRLQSLFSAAQSPLATMDRACLRADDGGSAGDQFDRGASDRGNPRLTIATGLAVTAASCLALLGVQEGTPYPALCAQLIGLGGGLGLLVPPMTSTLLGSVTKQYSGIASGVLNAMRQTGSAIGVALFGSLLSGAGGFIAGVRIALVIAAALALCAIIAAIVGVPRRA